jgi:effector-binding domain-containing protein
VVGGLAPPPPTAGHGELVGSALPAGTVATAVHFGPYNRLAAAHQAIRRWCVEHGYPLAGPCWEIYGHWIHEWCDDPSKIRTDVFYLLKPQGGTGELTGATPRTLPFTARPCCSD